jgi:hypothetical protein
VYGGLNLNLVRVGSRTINLDQVSYIWHGQGGASGPNEVLVFLVADPDDPIRLAGEQARLFEEYLARRTQVLDDGGASATPTADAQRAIAAFSSQRTRQTLGLDGAAEQHTPGVDLGPADPIDEDDEPELKGWSL